MLLPLLASVVLAKHGAVMLAGGTKLTSEMLDTFGELCGGKDKPIIVLPQCLPDPKDGVVWQKALQDAGFKNVFITTTEGNENTERGTVELPILRGRSVFVPSGDSALFVKRWGLAWCQKIFPKMIQQGGVWFGMDASAALAGDPIIDGENTVPGVGIVDAVVDYDYIVKHHELRLRNAYFSCRVQLGIGLDPGEWLVLRDSVIEKKVGLPQVFLRESG